MPTGVQTVNWAHELSGVKEDAIGIQPRSHSCCIQTGNLAAVSHILRTRGEKGFKNNRPSCLAEEMLKQNKSQAVTRLWLTVFTEVDKDFKAERQGKCNQQERGLCLTELNAADKHWELLKSLAET